ncbi:MAG: Cys-tRNA(Pro) deacylase, partial [Halomonas sp.]|nr:Cys-tRNA(Pro) deacylase [Halomonas sp.]
AFANIYVSAGRRGLEIELSPRDLATLSQATFVPLTT